MKFKSKPNYLVNCGTVLVKFSLKGEFETNNKEVIEILSKNKNVEVVKAPTKKQIEEISDGDTSKL
jgi:hypothetical protein